MKEQERLEVVDRINENLKINTVLSDRQREFEELSKDDKVKRYLELIEDIKLLKEYQKTFHDDVNKMINYEFFWAFNTREKGHGFSLCKHDIWYYIGSFYGNDYSFGYVNTEDVDGFECNDYVCLECGRVVHIENYVEFEKNHTVLKDREDLNYKKYRNIYYQMLYEHPVSDAQRLLIEEFNKNKEKNLLMKKRKK